MYCIATKNRPVAVEGAIVQECAERDSDIVERCGCEVVDEAVEYPSKELYDEIRKRR